MCFSVQVDQDIKTLSERFNAHFKAEDKMHFQALMGIENQIGKEKLETILGYKPSKRRKSPLIKTPSEDHRVYANYFTHTIILENGNRIIKPMRYRVRPQNSKEEIPAKYNVFNARIDALEKRQTWKPLFMRNHCLFPFTRFYEWVEPKGKSELISFKPENFDIMWAPALYDTWRSKCGTIEFSSFALLTDDPPPEILAQGHDRCPIFLKEELINDWLTPENKSKKEIYELLKQIQDTTYTHQFANIA